VCLILVAFFFFLCGLAHFLLAMGYGHTNFFQMVQMGNALVSATTSVYLIPLIPDMFALVDAAVAKWTKETKDSQSKLFTFMAFLCHEIRNPLFAITSSAECLQELELAPQAQEEVSSICDSSLLMLRLVNDVLDLSKLDSGKLQLECVAFDLHALMKRLGDNMARQVQRKHQGQVVLKCCVDTTAVPQVILGDSVRLLQIIYNLLSNACKFTSKGHIELKVTASTVTNTTVANTTKTKEGNVHTVTMSSDRPITIFASDQEHDDDDDDDEKEHKKKSFLRTITDLLYSGGRAAATSIRHVYYNRKSKNHPEGNMDGEGEHTMVEDDEEQVFSMALLDESNGDVDVECAGKNRQGDDEDDEYEMMMLSIVVSDTGIGIQPERLEDIFEPYTQAKLSDFRQHGGTGLGLSIISSLTKVMGGTVSVTSQYEKGATFSLQLPVKVPKVHPPSSSSASSCPNTSTSTSTTSSFSHLEKNDVCGDQSLSYLDYVGEFLPSNQKHVPKSFLECQRMPAFSHDLSQSQHSQQGPSCPASETTAGGDNDKDALPTAPTRKANTRILHDPDATTTVIRKSCSEGSRRPTLPPFDLPPNDSVVLVVDDNMVNRKILAKMLTAFNVEHRMASNGKEAVDAILASRNYRKLHGNNDDSTTQPLFGLVLMDISMPVMDGNEAIQIIRKANITVPIVALSANVLTEEKDRTIGLGANEFHSKPILRNNLHALCRRYLLPTN